MDGWIDQLGNPSANYNTQNSTVLCRRIQKQSQQNSKELNVKTHLNNLKGLFNKAVTCHWQAAPLEAGAVGSCVLPPIVLCKRSKRHRGMLGREWAPGYPQHWGSHCIQPDIPAPGTRLYMGPTEHLRDGDRKCV